MNGEAYYNGRLVKNLPREELIRIIDECAAEKLRLIEENIQLSSAYRDALGLPKAKEE